MRSRIISFITMLSVISMLVSQAIVPVFAAEKDYFTETEIKISDAAADAVMNFEKKLVIDEGDRILVEDVGKIMVLLRNNYPELFCLADDYAYNYKNDENNGRRYVSAINFRYIMTEEEYASALSEVNEWVAKVASLAPADFTDFEYALFFHDYLCANYEYDTDLSAHDLYSFIKNGEGVCQSYTYAFIMLMNKVGVDVSWAYSSEMNHIWNLVCLDGEWYHLDLTWDDPVGGAAGAARHNYFLLSDKGISLQENKHYGWVSPYRCDSDIYEGAPVTKVSSAYGYLNDGWYYINDGDLFVTKDPLEEGKLFRQLDFVWNVWESTSYYVGNYSGLMARDGLLYISSPTNIFEVNTEKNVLSDVYNYRGGDGYIYGFRWYLGDDGVTGADLSEYSVVASIGIAPDKVHKTEIFELGKVAVAGDADNNGKVNLSDASAMLKYIAKWNVSINMDGADYDGNGKVNLSDVSLVLKKIAGWK